MLLFFYFHFTLDSSTKRKINDEHHYLQFFSVDRMPAYLLENNRKSLETNSDGI